MTDWYKIFISFYENGHLFVINSLNGETEPAFEDWLHDQFGQRYSLTNPNGTWHIILQKVNCFYGREIWFKDRKEAMLFKLTWL